MNGVQFDLASNIPIDSESKKPIDLLISDYNNLYYGKYKIVTWSRLVNIGLKMMYKLYSDDPINNANFINIHMYRLIMDYIMRRNEIVPEMYKSIFEKEKTKYEENSKIYLIYRSNFKNDLEIDKYFELVVFANSIIWGDNVGIQIDLIIKPVWR